MRGTQIYNVQYGVHRGGSRLPKMGRQPQREVRQLIILQCQNLHENETIWTEKGGVPP